MSTILENYTEQVRDGMIVKPGTDPIVHSALGLAGESGEVADLVKKSQYLRSDGLDESKLVEELGDALWYLTQIASQIGVSLEQVAIANIQKLEARHPGVYSVAALSA